MPKVSSVSAAERETTVTACDEDDLVRIWSAQRRFITKMRKDPLFIEVKSGFHGTSEWAEFTIPADRWSPVGIKRTRGGATREQREAAALRLAGRGQPAARRGCPEQGPLSSSSTKR